MFESFLLPMLEFYPSLRATARQCLSHGWLQMPPDLNYKMTEQEVLFPRERKKIKKKIKSKMKKIINSNIKTNEKTNL